MVDLTDISGIERAGDRALQADLNRHLAKQEKAKTREQCITDRAQDMFMSLPDFYVSRDGLKHYTNMEDAMNSLTQAECITIARAVRDNDITLAGHLLSAALMRVCTINAEYEVDNE